MTSYSFIPLMHISSDLCNIMHIRLSLDSQRNTGTLLHPVFACHLLYNSVRITTTAVVVVLVVTLVVIAVVVL